LRKSREIESGKRKVKIMDQNLFSMPALGYVRVAAISPELRVADVRFNAQKTIEAMNDARKQGAQIIVFPELGLTGYTCGDLFYQHALLEQAKAALIEIANASKQANVVACVGLPLAMDGRLFDCAALVGKGRVLGIVPKTFLPNYSEFYEMRWFASSMQATSDFIRIGDDDVIFGTDLLFRASNIDGCVIGIEICEDLWAVNPPSGNLAVGGATILLNPSASPETLAKSDYRRELLRNQSARCLAAYVYAGSGPNESTMDVVFGGHSIIAENGSILAESERFKLSTTIAIADIDLQRLSHERQNNTTFAAERERTHFRESIFELGETQSKKHGAAKLLRPLSPTPFVPSDKTQRDKHCNEIFNIQATGLAKRLKHTNAKRITIGVSGGLDSTLALLATIRAFDQLGLDHKGIHAITMPGLGTTRRTKENALGLMKQLGVTSREISIAASVRQHFKDIRHDENDHDVVYENAQARERTQILMDVANEIGGFVVGTGDLSEAALGWMTFNGDHMSMYHVNAGVPKTLVRYLIAWCAESVFSGETSRILRDIVATPISPELLPLDKGKLKQKTEDTVGPYVLHDFFLFHHVRYGYPPRKIFYLARLAFKYVHKESNNVVFSDAEILKWLKVFYTRFFSQQFKRSSMPDGPKVGSVALSPRGDWRMPSDADPSVWLAELEEIERAITK
jgi:NAD+ synthase (glutamine-hydrolysing)